MTPRVRLSAEHRRALQAYVKDLEREKRPLPGMQVEEVLAIDWAQVAQATGLPQKLLFKHLEEAKAILAPHLETYGVANEQQLFDPETIRKVAERYLADLRRRGEGIPALSRQKGPYLDWKTIAIEMGVPYPDVEEQHHVLRNLFKPALEELGARLTQPASAKEKPKKVDPLEGAVEAYINRLRETGQGVPIRCLRLSPSLNWGVFCKEFDCKGIATTARRREAIAKRLMEAATELGARYHSESDRTLCALADELRRALATAPPEELQTLITKHHRLRWSAIADLIGKPLEALLPYRLRLRPLVEEQVRERLESAKQTGDIAEITQRVENLVNKMHQQGSAPNLLDNEGRLVLERLAREIRLKTDFLRPHRVWLEPWLRSCVRILFKQR